MRISLEKTLFQIIKDRQAKWLNLQSQYIISLRLVVIANLKSLCIVIAKSRVLLIDSSCFFAVLVCKDFGRAFFPSKQSVDNTLNICRDTSFDFMSSVWREVIIIIRKIRQKQHFYCRIKQQLFLTFTFPRINIRIKMETGCGLEKQKQKARGGKERRRQLRQKAIMERDLSRLREWHLKLKKIVATFILVTIILTLVVICTTLVCTHFWRLNAQLPYCSLSRFEGANYLKPFCINCMEGYSLIQGACRKSA